MKFLNVAVTAATLFCMSTAVVAAEDKDVSGFRFGGGYNESTAETIAGSYGDGYRLEVGYDFNKVVGMSLGYQTNDASWYSYNNFASFQGDTLDMQVDLGYTFTPGAWQIKPYGSVGLASYNESGRYSSGGRTYFYNYKYDVALQVGLGVRATVGMFYMDLGSRAFEIDNVILTNSGLTIGLKF